MKTKILSAAALMLLLSATQSFATTGTAKKKEAKTLGVLVKEMSPAQIEKTTITITQIKGKDTTITKIEIETQKTIKQVKTTVSEVTGANTQQIQVYFKNIPLLDENRTLASYGVRPGYPVTALVKW